MGYKDRVYVISPDLDDLLIFFLILLLIPSIIISYFTSFNLFSVYVLLIVSFLSVFTLSHIFIKKVVDPEELKKVGAKNIVSGLSMFLIVLLIPAIIIANLVHSPFVFVVVYIISVIVFLIILVRLIIKKIIICGA